MKQAVKAFGKSGFLATLICLVLSLGFPNTVQAAELITRAGGQPVLVQQGETVEKVLVFDADARIAGRVTDMVVVINGNVTLEPTADVDLVIDLGGHVSNSAAKVKSGIFELNLTEKISQELIFGALLFLGVGFIRAFLSLVGIILLTLGGALFAKRMEKIRTTFASVPARLLGVGLASALVLNVVLALLSLTVIGIPLAALIFLLSLIAAGVGLLQIIDYWGERFLNPVLHASSGLKYWFTLSLLYVALANIPLFGMLFTIGTLLAGLGLMVAWAVRSRRFSS